MALPTSYMNSVKRLPDILEAILTAQAPPTFHTRFLEQLGFKSKGDRLIIGVLKDLGLLDEKGTPTDTYYKYLDQSQSAIILANGIRSAWSDLFAVNVNAHEMTKSVFSGKLKTLSQGKLSDRVIDCHFMTFNALVKAADFSALQQNAPREAEVDVSNTETIHNETDNSRPSAARQMNLGGLVYNIQIVLPESRDQAVYDALFKSLKEHLS